MSYTGSHKPKSKILFVDDEPLILQSLNILFRKDYDVFTVPDPTKALDIVRKNDITVIVSDQRMPNMTGVELLRQVKEISPETIRILMTGYADLHSIIESINVGEIFRYIGKPWRIDKLRQTIDFACRVARERAWLAVQRLKASDNSTFNDTSKYPKSKPELLFVDSNLNHLKIFKDFFSARYKVHTSASADEAFEILHENSISVVSSDTRVGRISGGDFLITVKERQPDVTTVLITDVRDANTAIRLINEGQVYRYLIKPVPRESLRMTIDAAALHYKLHQEMPSGSMKNISQQIFSNPKSFASPPVRFADMIQAI
jgi:DNA-binding NtrC family response regulator